MIWLLQKLIFLLLLVSCLSGWAEDPWGIDADINFCRDSNNGFKASPLSQWGVTAIKFHQDVISPADGPRSHFLPSSSQYTLEAMEKYGFFTGYLLGCDRLMRENDDPWVYPTKKNSAGQEMKWNPVPILRTSN